MLILFISKLFRAEVYADLAVESATCLLETEVVIKFGIGEVATFKREVVATVFDAV
jgi:hypothetical protein